MKKKDTDKNCDNCGERETPDSRCEWAWRNKKSVNECKNNGRPHWKPTDKDSSSLIRKDRDLDSVGESKEKHPYGENPDKEICTSCDEQFKRKYGIGTMEGWYCWKCIAESMMERICDECGHIMHPKYYCDTCQRWVDKEPEIPVPAEEVSYKKKDSSLIRTVEPVDKLEDMFSHYDWPIFKEPCEHCQFKQTPQNGPFCGKCLHRDRPAEEDSLKKKKPIDKDSSSGEKLVFKERCPRCGWCIMELVKGE